MMDARAQGRRRAKASGAGAVMQGTIAARKRPRAAAAAPGSVKAELTALKQERILEAATRLFLRNGYHGCTMDQIAAAIGVTKPFIYYQFRDKGEILAAISGHGAELSLSAIDDAERQAGSVTARMRWFCRRLTEIVIDNGHYLAVYHRETSNLDDADRKRITRRRLEIDARVSRLVTRGVEAGEFAVADPAIAASAVTMMISYCFQWYGREPRRSHDEFVDIMADIAMRTLLPAGARAGQGGEVRTAGRRR
jgi:TetR/AcrR family transcriptional regulator, cholesterol catabolism regulator